MSIRLLIIDDHEVVRLGLKQAFEGSEIEVCGEGESSAEALKKVNELKPDVVLLDIRMEGGDGLDALGRIKLDHPDLPILLFSAYDNPTYMARAYAWGAAGYLVKNVSRETLLESVKSVAEGELIWGRDKNRRVSFHLSNKRMPGDIEVPLTQREGEVLTQMAHGLTNKEIAKALGISYETVKEHVQHILRKIGVSDRTQAAVWAVRKNLV